MFIPKCGVPELDHYSSPPDDRVACKTCGGSGSICLGNENGVDIEEGCTDCESLGWIIAEEPDGDLAHKEL